MYRLGLRLGMTFIICSCVMASAAAEYRIQGLSQFGKDDQQKLRLWLQQGVEASEQTIGEFPFTFYLHLYPKRSHQPVPWANTWREHKQSVHLYVDQRFELARFVNDWTLYHELSHLALPYVGNWHAWFAEGFASYMQYQVMARAKVLQGTPQAAYVSKIQPHWAYYQSHHSAASVARRLLESGNYPAAYWGGAWFFVLADKRLQAQGQDLVQVIRRYQHCCRLADDTLEDVVHSLDSGLVQPVFTPLLAQFEEMPARDVFVEQDLLGLHSEENSAK